MFGLEATTLCPMVLQLSRERGNPHGADSRTGTHLTVRNDFVHGKARFVCHEADDGEDDEAGENAGATVHQRNH